MCKHNKFSLRFLFLPQKTKVKIIILPKNLMNFILKNIKINILNMDFDELTKEKIVKIIKSWLGTRFRYQGRIKKNINNHGGVDCLGLIFGVCDELDYKYNGKLLSTYDDIIYSKKPNYNILKERFSKFFKVKQIKDINVGDIVLKKLFNEQYHLMFYIGESFIHASAITFNVVEHNVDNFDNSIIYSMFKEIII